MKLWKPPTFVSPVREPVHHVQLLGGREAQRFAGHARLVVDISVEHVGLEGAAETRQRQSIIKWQRGCRRHRWHRPNLLSDAVQEVNESPSGTHAKWEPIHLYPPVNMLQMSTDTAASANYIKRKVDELYYECKTTPL